MLLPISHLLIRATYQQRPSSSSLFFCTVAFGDSGKVVSGRTYFNVSLLLLLLVLLLVSLKVFLFNHQDTFIYDTKKTSWSKVDVVVPPNTYIYPRSHHSACCFKDRGILYFGGRVTYDLKSLLVVFRHVLSPVFLRLMHQDHRI